MARFHLAQKRPVSRFRLTGRFLNSPALSPPVTSPSLNPRSKLHCLVARSAGQQVLMPGGGDNKFFSKSYFTSGKKHGNIDGQGILDKRKNKDISSQ